ncbi:hypothetical protein HDU97_009129 [Phlyctochytrium planicorne]|nr:hypothetical protein HDU97_009129 [Phlyctochytrium planicorne]
MMASHNDLPTPPVEPEGLESGVHLVWASGSAPAQRAQIALYEKGIPFSLHEVSLANRDTRRAEWIGKLNPRCQVPILVDEGVSVSQSLSILLHLEEKYPNISLLGKGDLRAETITRMLEADDWINELFHTSYGFAFGYNKDLKSRQDFFNALPKELDLWEGYLAKNAQKYSGGWLVGPSFSLAGEDCFDFVLFTEFVWLFAEVALIPAMMALVYRLGMGFGQRHRLANWYEQVSARESFHKSIPPGWANKPISFKIFEGVDL